MLAIFNCVLFLPSFIVILRDCVCARAHTHVYVLGIFNSLHLSDFSTLILAILAYSFLPPPETYSFSSVPRF